MITAARAFFVLCPAALFGGLAALAIPLVGLMVFLFFVGLGLSVTA